MSLPSLPPDVTLPTREEARRAFAVGMTGALADTSAEWASKTLQPPVAAAVPLLRSAVSNAVGMGGDFAALAAAANSGAIGAEAAGAISAAVAGLVEGTLSAAAELAAGTAASSAIASASESIPVLGAVIGTVVSGIARGVGAAAYLDILEAEVERQLHEKLAQKCAAWVTEDAPYGTSAPPLEISPGDFFRRLNFDYLVWQKKYKPRGQPPIRLPLDAASMYLMLCGGETQGFGLVTRERYRQIVAAARAANPKIGGGIPAADQRRMWKLIKAIMTTSLDPLSPAPIGDRGYALMPILQDIVNSYYFRVAEGNGPGWDDNLATLLSDEITSRYRASATLDEATAAGYDYDGAGAIYRESSCAGQEHGYPRHVDLGPALKAASIEFQAGLISTFQDFNGRWKMRPNIGTSTAPRGVLVLSDGGKVGKEIERATTPPSRARGLLAKGAVAIVSGAAAYMAARRWF